MRRRRADAARATKTGPADVDVLNACSTSSTPRSRPTAPAVAAAARGGAGLARRFLEQEQAHADGHPPRPQKIGGTPIKPKANYDFPTLADRTDFLSFASDLENTTIAAYIDVAAQAHGPQPARDGWRRS